MHQNVWPLTAISKILELVYWAWAMEYMTQQARGMEMYNLRSLVTMLNQRNLLQTRAAESFTLEVLPTLV